MNRGYAWTRFPFYTKELSLLRITNKVYISESIILQRVQNSNYLKPLLARVYVICKGCSLNQCEHWEMGTAFTNKNHPII